MNKSDLRKIYKQKRKDLSKKEIENLEKKIYNQVFNLDLSLVKNVHIFLSIKKLKEINTKPIINFLRKHNKRIIISKSDFKTSTLKHFVFEENTLIKENFWGIPEPINAQEFNVKQIDLVFVPMLISDKKNYRVGYGKGFYDRFLSNCKESVKTIGLNFFKPVDKIDDANEFDVALNSVLFP